MVIFYTHQPRTRRVDWEKTMTTLGIYIFNATRNAWLQDDEHSWGPFHSACEFTASNEDLAEDIRTRETAGNDATYVMAALS